VIKDYYKWTFNLCINPVHIVLIIVWVGNTRYEWEIRKPFKVSSVV
jgi:hypothetical protein